MKAILSASTLVLFLLSSACTKEKEPDWADPIVSLYEVGDCKQFGLKTDDHPSDQDCIKWEYINDSVLSISHINAGFNCCPIEFLVDIVLTNDTLLIKESERDAPCDCICLYDLNYEISPVPKGSYTITVEEPYARDGILLEANINLIENKRGEFCVTRTDYPWGI